MDNGGVLRVYVFNQHTGFGELAMQARKEEKQDIMIYGVDERTITKVFQNPTFSLTTLSNECFKELERSMCGVTRSYLPEFNFVAPLVPYTLTIKRGTDGYLKIAVYKQRKVDNEGKEYFIQSVGISAEVEFTDIVSYIDAEDRHLLKQLSIIDLLGSIKVSTFRQYNQLVDLTSNSCYEKYDNPVITPWAARRAEVIGFLRDGKKKPGYKGCAHIAAVNLVTAPTDTNFRFTRPGYEFMGWIDVEFFEVIANKQNAGYVDPLLDGPLEPWSLSLGVSGIDWETVADKLIGEDDC